MFQEGVVEAWDGIGRCTFQEKPCGFQEHDISVENSKHKNNIKIIFDQFFHCLEN